MKEYHFSRKHWGTIIFCFILYMLNNACTTDGENVFLPRLAEANGWDYTRVLLIASVAGCLSVVGQLLIGKICAARDARFTMALCLFLTAGFFFLYVSAQQIWVYAIGLFGVICCSMSYSYIGANALIASWFPQKKGIAMGFVSIGAPVSTMAMVSVLTILVRRLGLSGSAGAISLVLVLMTVICIVVVRDRPEQCGETPDGLPVEEVEQLTEKNGQNATKAVRITEEDVQIIGDTDQDAEKIGIAENSVQEAKLSLRELLRMKETWYIIFVTGVCSLGLTGVMSQFVVRCTQSGFSEEAAIAMMSFCAVVGIFGSMLMGFAETRLGTAKAYTIFALLFAAALLINFTDIHWMVQLSVPMLGCVITILQIFLTSFEVSVYGRENFRQANAFIFPIICMLGQVSLLIISACISIFGEVRYAYLIFAVLFVISVFVSRKLRV